MKCIIIEDQPPAQRILKRYVEDIGTLVLVDVYSDALAARPRLEQGDIDIVFLDIHLPKMSGIDFLRSSLNMPAVILTTAFPDHALESYELDVVDYLLKPFSFARFVKAVGKVEARYNPSLPSEVDVAADIFIKSGYEQIKISIPDISYIRADGDYTELYVSDKRHLSQESLKNWSETLEPHQFIRVHKSYVINLNHISRYASNSIILSSTEEIPIGRAFKEEFEKRMSER